MGANYRPISILSAFSKIAEVCIYDKVNGLFQSVVSDDQHGFLPGRSTHTNLISLNHYLYKSFSANIQVDVVYTDFSKAFDKLNIAILIKKKTGLGLSGSITSLLASYLVDRSLLVTHNGYFSAPIAPTSGVPQGSNLGPLLFLIYINDIVEEVNCRVLLYADDAKIFNSISNLEQAAQLQHNLNSFSAWCAINKLQLNVNKCKIVSYHRSRQPILFDYKLNNSIIPRGSMMKDLGILYDSSLSFNSQVEMSTSKALRTLGFILRMNRLFNNPNTIKILFHALVLPLLEYSSLIVPYQTSKQIQRLERVQKKFLKVYVGKSTGSYPPRGCDYLALCNDFNVNTLESRRTCFLAIFVIKLLNNHIYCPDILQDFPIWVHRTNSRNNIPLYPPRINNRFDSSSPLFNIINSINLVSQYLPNFDIFNAPRNIKIAGLINSPQRT